MTTECSIDTVAFGGDGVGRLNNLAVFVPYTLPGEIVDIEILVKKPRFARAVPKSIKLESRNRTAPPCPHFFTCGGCQLQHSSYEYQLEIKRKFIQDALERIGKMTLDVPSVVPSSKPFGYRRHISLKIRKVEAVFTLGFRSNQNSHLPINTCLLLGEKDSTAALLSYLQTLIQSLDPKGPFQESTLKIHSIDSGSYFIYLVLKGALSKAKLKQLQASLIKNPLISGGEIETPKDHLTFGNSDLFFTFKDLKIHYSPKSFLQNHPEQSANIYNWALEALKNSSRILDLYCGIGTSSLALASQGAVVLGIESNPHAIFLAEKNAQINQLSGLEFQCINVESGASSALKKFQPDALLLNPPKMGAFREVLQAIGKSSVQKIVYVSCNPASLARDLSILKSLGFQLEEIQGFDMFPQTTHVETAAVLTKK